MNIGRITDVQWSVNAERVRSARNEESSTERGARISQDRDLGPGVDDDNPN